MGNLTEHFNLEEFRSGDGAVMPTGVPDNLKKTAEMLEILRAALGGVPLMVLSGYRSPEWNARVGGAPDSFHIRGMAADVASKTLSPQQVQSVALDLQNQGRIGGVGLYPGFTHVDWGPKRSWTPETKGY